jgi:chromosome segregation ATPase
MNLSATSTQPGAVLDEINKEPRKRPDPRTGQDRLSSTEGSDTSENSDQRDRLMNGAESPTQIGAKTSLQVWVFEMALRAIGTGGTTYADVLARLRRLLAAGTSPTELMEVVRRRQAIEPLPESAQGVLDLLNDAIRRDAGEVVESAEVQDADPQAVAPHEEVKQAAKEEVKEERIARPHADSEALTRSYERSRDPEPAAVARATALAADLAAAQAALAVEQRRTRELNLALAEKNAVAEASRTRVDEILRDYERLKSETNALRSSLAARDSAILQMRESLDERDSRIPTLHEEPANIVSPPEAGAESGAQLEADLQAAVARADAISLELKVAHEAAAELNAQLKRSESRLNATLTELGAVKTQSSSYLELLRTREWRRELEAQEPATRDAQRVAQPKQAADLQQEEQDTQIAQLRAEHAAQIERLQAEADQREQEIGVLRAHLQEARRPVQAFEADLKRLTEELAAKDANAAVFYEENRQLSADLDWTRSALEECKLIIRRLERSKSNSANVRARIQTGIIERLESVPEGSAAAGADPGAAESGAANRSAELIRIDGEQTKTYVLAKRTRIGRAAACELRVDCSSVSRHHAIVVVGPRDTIIEDLNSTNGVLVNDRKVTRHALSDGDVLTIGETQFRYVTRLHDGPPGPNPAD